MIMSFHKSWYFDRQEKLVGPFSLAQLHTMVEEGKIDPGQIVWQVGTDRRTYVRADKAVATLLHEKAG
jgi:hypothetical protein